MKECSRILRQWDSQSQQISHEYLAIQLSPIGAAFTTFLRQRVLERGRALGSSDLHRYPDRVCSRVDSAKAHASKELTEVVFLHKLELLENLIISD